MINLRFNHAGKGHSNVEDKLVAGDCHWKYP